jgi:siroheme synthase (precorrin-2 oxidase/ferrochelatase)
MNYRPYTREDLIRIFGTYMGNIVHNQALLREQYEEEQRQQREKHLEYMREMSKQYRLRNKSIYGKHAGEKRLSKN